MEERGYEVFAPEEEEPSRDSEVFFNDEMKLNRDLSQVAAEVFRDQTDIEEFVAGDMLSASGIRGFRYSEVADKLILNDTNPEAVESIRKGLEANDIEAQVYNKDANVLMSENWKRFNLLDIDPFGPFTSFLDSAARSMNYTGFIGLTATDNSAASGSYPTVCERRYGSKPLRNSFMHETGLRIYIKEVFRNFARYDKCFDPKLCFQHRHYARVMGRVTESKKRTNRTIENIGYLSFCPQCRWRKLERVPECKNCGSDVKHAGPLWTGKLSDSRFTEKMMEKIPEEWEDSREFLERLDAEAEMRVPFYDLHEMSSSVDVSVPKRDRFIEKLRQKGYPVSRTHFEPTGFRTEAHIEDIRQVLESLD
jgi:tRNA (guanine26-N2/guanine27-N2)-dimethyltransferase